MYRILAINTQTGIAWYQYGFSREMMNTLWFLFNEKDNEYFSVVEILEISKLCLTFSTFWKCLTGRTETKGVMNNYVE